MGNIVYIVVEDYKNDYEESGILVSIFSTIEKAEEYFEKIRKSYKINYNEDNRDDKWVQCDNDVEVEVIFDDNDDYYHIYIEQQKII